MQRRVDLIIVYSLNLPKTFLLMLVMEPKDHFKENGEDLKGQCGRFHHGEVKSEPVMSL